MNIRSHVKWIDTWVRLNVQKHKKKKKLELGV